MVPVLNNLASLTHTLSDGLLHGKATSHMASQKDADGTFLFVVVALSCFYQKCHNCGFTVGSHVILSFILFTAVPQYMGNV